MSSLIFDPASYTVTCGSDSIGLLAKEFALLQFLYDHRNQAFTREQLLDRVWLLEYPVERTVDDHIYRLRRKLRHWPHIAINTVRGYGYSLTVRDRRAVGNPSVQDPEVQEAMRELFKNTTCWGRADRCLLWPTGRKCWGLKWMNFIRFTFISFKAISPGFWKRTESPSGKNCIGCCSCIGEWRCGGRRFFPFCNYARECWHCTFFRTGSTGKWRF